MGTGICVCVWFFKNLTHFCHVLVHQNSKGGGSVKNVLTRNFVTVPDSLGLLPLPQAPAEEPQSPSVPVTNTTGLLSSSFILLPEDHLEQLLTVLSHSLA